MKIDQYLPYSYADNFSRDKSRVNILHDDPDSIAGEEMIAEAGAGLDIPVPSGLDRSEDPAVAGSVMDPSYLGKKIFNILICSKVE